MSAARGRKWARDGRRKELSVVDERWLHTFTVQQGGHGRHMKKLYVYIHVFYFSSSGGCRGGQRGCCDAACETSQHSELPQEVAAQRTAKIDRKCHLNVELLRLSLTVWSCGPVGGNMQNKLKKAPKTLESCREFTVAPPCLNQWTGLIVRMTA